MATSGYCWFDRQVGAGYVACMRTLILFAVLGLGLGLGAAAQAMEIFLVAGQSNSANHGEVRLKPTNKHVLTYDVGAAKWRAAFDPQPSASGSGGSPWPVFGSVLAHDVKKTIGIISVGIGGSAASEWMPVSGGHYWRLHDVMHAAGVTKIRGVLWHQGEADVLGTTTAKEYEQMLTTIIDQLNVDAGYVIPWFVAEVSYVNFEKFGDAQRARMAEIHHGQELLWASGKAFRGANTDDMAGPAWRYDGIHLNKKGLIIHGERWAAAVKRELYRH